MKIPYINCDEYGCHGHKGLTMEWDCVIMNHDNCDKGKSECNDKSEHCR